MNIRKLQKTLTREDGASSKSPDQFPERQPYMTQSNDFLPSLFTSTNITFRRNTYQYFPKAVSRIQIEPASSSQKVDFKKLPFYRVLTELVRPSELLPDISGSGCIKNTFRFYLTQQQVEDIRNSQLHRFGSSKVDYMIQVQMRFCLKEEIFEQEDCIPPGVTAKVNNQNCHIPFHSKLLPGDLKKKKVLMKPIDITCLVKLTSVESNEVLITCPPNFGKKYIIGVFLVRKLTSYELANGMRRNNVQVSEFTREKIIEKLNEDAHSEIATTSLCVTLACPLGKMRMITPGRAFSCTHLQCFDVRSYLQMNEFRPTWICPVCNKPAPFDSLVVDGYFKEVLASDKLVEDENEVQLLPDGSWKVLITSDRDQSRKGTSGEVKIEKTDTSVGISEEVDVKREQVVDLISSDEEEEINALPFKKRKLGFFENEVIVVDLD
ncbi:GSCOCT00013986001.2-RA-CDS [Cotesia congregata]|uniref:E3 SUMO-protein ligase PIAS2-like_Cc n=1 Tax=Cotesia congregata TaxID=51543 RepID=A0A8J2HP36_COTCN|nr:GSCOCT00013986001.2-RA-CDS [Cotesia congregata]CAG5101021.1 E3 SUMO-protein ligase PIAS2-like_Cc [Cotesia congregata]